MRGSILCCNPWWRRGSTSGGLIGNRYHYYHYHHHHHHHLTLYLLQGEDWIDNHLNPTMWLNYLFFTDPGMWGRGPMKNHRPIIFHRWGGLGNHRMPLGFSGDVVSSWESLQFQTYFTATAANVLYGMWSHDIGGFWSNIICYECASANKTALSDTVKDAGVPPPVDPQLFTRWLQWGSIAPVMRTHTTKNTDDR
jgi:hypothetical protein